MLKEFKFRLGGSQRKGFDQHNFNYAPENKKELQDLLEKLIVDRGLNGDFNDIDTSHITDMSYLFVRKAPNGLGFDDVEQEICCTNAKKNNLWAEFNGDISLWM